MRRKRGGAMLFILVMVGLMTIAVLASVELSTSAASTAGRREGEARARYAFEGAVQLFLCDFRKKTKSLPGSTVYTVGEYKVDLTATDNSANIPRTIRFEGSTVVSGRTYAYSEVRGNRLDPSPVAYALFVNSNFDPTYAITLGANGANGDLLVNGSIASRSNPFVIHGDVEAVGTSLPTSPTISGNTMTGETAIVFHGVNGLSYLAAALTSLLTDTLAGYIFPGLDPYPVLYRLGPVNLSGTFTGKGTLFVDGAVTVVGNIVYGSADSRLVVIATGGVTVNAGVANIAGFYYTTGTFRNNGNLKVTSGAVAAQSVSLGGSLEIVHDPTFWTTETEAVKHKVPGFWP